MKIFKLNELQMSQLMNTLMELPAKQSLSSLDMLRGLPLEQPPAPQPLHPGMMPKIPQPAHPAAQAISHAAPAAQPAPAK